MAGSRHGQGPAALAALLTTLLLGLAVPANSAAAAAEPAAPYPVRSFEPRPSDPDRLERAWATWQARGLRRYVTRVQVACFCGPIPAVVTEVRGRTVTSVREQGRARELRYPGYEVPQLYRMLRRAFRTADEVRVRFRGGVPRHIFVDRQEIAADDEVTYAVRIRRG